MSKLLNGQLPGNPSIPGLPGAPKIINLYNKLIFYMLFE